MIITIHFAGNIKILCKLKWISCNVGNFTILPVILKLDCYAVENYFCTE